MPLDEIERMEENSEFIARNLEEVGQGTISSKCQDQRLKLKQCENETDSTKTLRIIISKLAIWNLLDYDSAGSSTSKRCNPADLAPWLAPVIDNVDFFYDGTNRNSSLDS
ncbi:hypothetical protein BASA83_007182 [Batrachochytrium salamandrivorans]|nr:hypothetical protein BASA83_007182 [Batrachochytrium salamandrivorans]